MKKLLFILFILPVFCFAQSPVTPSFKRKIPIDSLLGYSFPGVTGTFWLPDTAWVKKHASGSFLNNSTSKQTSANGYVDGFLRGQKLIADSDIYIRTTTKKAWYSAYGVLNMAGDVGIRGETGAHDLMMYNNLYAVGTAFTDFKYANNGAASYLYLGVAGSLSYGAASSGTAGTSATVTDWLKIDVNGHTFLPGLRDTTATDTIVGYKNHQLYKIPGGGGSPAWGVITGTLSDQTDLQTALNAKQATLVSGTNIKTINSASLLGSSNILLQTPLTAGTDYLAPTGSAAGLTGLTSTQVTTALGFTPVTNARTVNGKALSSNITLGLASADFANQGSATTVLHGNASGNPSFGQIAIADLSATGTPSSTTYLRGDNTWATASGSGSPQVELFPHTIDSGAGTEASPYTNADNTGGIQTEVDAQAAGRGGGIKLATGRFNVTTPITITSNSIKIEGVVAGYNADPNAQSQGINGSSLIVTGSAISISGTGYPVGRTAATQLTNLYIFGTTTRQSIGSSTGTIGVKLQSYIDQPTLRHVNMGGFDYGIKSVNTSGGWVDFAYFQQVEIQGGRVGIFYDAAAGGGGNYGQHYIACAIAETDEHNVYVSTSSTNANFVFTGTAFYRGSSAVGVTNPANVYFGGDKSRFDGCEFAQAGFNLIAGTHLQADGLYLAGNYNTVSGCAFLDNNASGSAGIRITGNNNIVSGCTFNNNNTDVIITGNNNIVYVSSTTTVTDSGTGNTIISSHMVLSPVVSSATNAKGLSLSPVLSATANGANLIGLDITNSFTGGLVTGGIVINSGGSSYTNGTYTSVPIVSTGGTGGLATVVITGGSVSTITVTTAGSGYVLGNTATIAAASIGGTGSGFLGIIDNLAFTSIRYDGARIDGIDIGRGGGFNANNTEVGADALKKNTSGTQNTAFGSTAGSNNTTGSNLSFFGSAAGVGNTTGPDNSYFGSNAGSTNSTAMRASFFGSGAGAASNGNYQTFFGYSAGSLNTGQQGTYVGGLAGSSITTGNGNTIVGFFTAQGLTTCSTCTVIGSQLNGFGATTSLTNAVILGDGSGNMRFVANNSGQVYIGAGSATYPTFPASSKFTVDNSTTLGTIPWTQTTTTQRNAISSPAEALTTYDLTQHVPYFYNGTAYQQMGVIAAQTSVSGSTSGTAVFSQPMQGSTYKVVIIKFAALVGTASYTFPTAFSTTPSVVGTDDVAAGIVTSKSTTAVTVTGATTSGSLTLIGY